MKMKVRSCIAGALAGGFIVGTAAAADLSPAPMYTKAPPVPLMYNWNGYYAGFNVGGSWGRQDTAIAGTGTLSPSVDGVIGGGQIGVNWQEKGSPWVAGIELDIQGSGQSGNGTYGAILLATDALPFKDELQWFGTVRGRFGYAFGDMGRWLAYGTFGLAYGGAKLSGSGTVAGVGVGFSQTGNPVGFTAGAGLEWAFADRWSAKLEYLYIDFLSGGPTVALPGGVNLTTGDLTDNIVRVGANYHF
jgi:outer membrane immunogenic protein